MRTLSLLLAVITALVSAGCASTSGSASNTSTAMATADTAKPQTLFSARLQPTSGVVTSVLADGRVKVAFPGITAFSHDGARISEEQQRQLLIDHELVHLQRRDPQQLLLLRILVALCWFNPVLRLIEQAFIRSMELAVDKTVLQKQPEQALLYGQTLLCSLKQSQAEQMPALMPGFIQSNASQSFYQQRLQLLFQPTPQLSFWQRWRITALLCSTALLLNVGCAQLSFSSPPQEWVLPVGKVPINSFYGEKHPFRKNRPHQGLDFGAKRGATVKAAQKGKVLIADAKSLNNRYGKAVLIDHGHGYQTLYAHLDDFYIEAGQTVEPGQPIGKVGSTGRVTGPHLHFELLVDGKQQDPTPYLKLQ